MGNCQCDPVNIQNEYSDKLWDAVLFERNCCLLRSIFNDLVQIQKWSSIGNEDQSIYAWRTRQKLTCLPPVLACPLPQKNKIEVEKHIVYTQVVDPLSKFCDLRIEHYAIILRSVFEALTILEKKFGMFEISESNIFLDRGGQTSVWINSNLASNKVEKPMKNDLKEEEYVEKLIMSLESRVKPSVNFKMLSYRMKIKQALYFFQEYLERNHPSLGRTIKGIKQYRIRENHNQQPFGKVNSEKGHLCESKTTGIQGTSSNFFHGAVNQKPNQIHKSKQKKDVDPDKLLYDLMESENIKF